MLGSKASNKTCVIVFSDKPLAFPFVARATLGFVGNRRRTPERSVDAFVPINGLCLRFANFQNPSPPSHTNYVTLARGLFLWDIGINTECLDKWICPYTMPSRIDNAPPLEGSGSCFFVTDGLFLEASKKSCFDCELLTVGVSTTHPLEF